MEVIVKFLSKSTVFIRALVYDSDGELADPTSITVTVVDPDGTTQVPATAMSKHGTDTGTYDYFYTTESDCAEGWWSGEVWATDEIGERSVLSSKSFGFDVKAGL